MEKANLLSWFLKVFVPSVREILDTGPVVPIFDAHAPLHLHIVITKHLDINKS